MAEREITEAIPEALAGQRLDRVVAVVADVSRREASDLIVGGRVVVDGAPAAKPSTRIDVGARIDVRLPERPEGLVPDPSIDVPVVHVDDDVVVVDKPAGLVVHPGTGVASGTMVHGLLARFPQMAFVGPPDRPGIVHRLDKGTSGLLMVARTADALDDLAAQLRVRSVERRYATVVVGLVEADGGVIDGPLGRDPRDATRRTVVADGRPARTHYEVEARYPGPPDGPGPGASRLACRLETGRTHQIRAHLRAIGHPVVGDPLYGGPTTVAGVEMARPFLHAALLAFDHPRTGERLRFTSPLPDDLVAVVARLEGRS